MSKFAIVNDLDREEESRLYEEFPVDEYIYLKVADLINMSWQPFFDDRLIGIVKSNDSIALLEAHGIATLGYESTDELLTSFYVTEDLSVVELRDLEIVYSRFHNIPLEILQTDRCKLREHTLEDYSAIVKIYDDESMTKYIQPLFEPKEEKEYLKNYIDTIYKLFGYGLWLIIDKASGEVIGRAGVETRESCIEDKQVELSYQVKKAFQNKGIATEVCLSIIDYTFNTIGKDSVIARVDEDNEASIKVINKLGFEPYKDGVYIKRKQF